MERGGNRELEFNRCRVLVGVDENVLEMDGGDGYTTVLKYIIPLRYTLRMVYFILYILP